MADVKYMGGAHERRINKGDKFGGRLKNGLSTDLVFSRENNFIVNTDELGLKKDEVELLLEDPDFKDVSDHQRVPSSLAETRWYGHSQYQDPEDIEQLQGESDSKKSTDSSSKSSSSSSSSDKK